MSEEKRIAPNDDSNVVWSIGVVKGRVELHFETPRTRVVMDSENARVIAEGIAKAAYQARYGTKPADGQSRLGEALRERMINRGAIVSKSMAESGRSNRDIVAAMVDIIMSELA